MIANKNEKENQGLRDRLTRYYNHHCPEKINQIELLIDKYINQEKALFKSLISKYGPEPLCSDEEKLNTKNRIELQKKTIINKKDNKIDNKKKDIFNGKDIPDIFDEHTQKLLNKIDKLNGKITDELLAEI